MPTKTKRRPRVVKRAKRKSVTASRGSSNVILKLGSAGGAPQTLVTYGPPGSSSSAGGGGSSSSSTNGGGGPQLPWPYAMPSALGAAPAPTPGPRGGSPSGGGGGGGPPVGPDVFKTMMKEELGDLWRSLKKAHTAGNRDVLAQFSALKEEVRSAGDGLAKRQGNAARAHAQSVLKAIKRAQGEVQNSVGNARDAVDALRYAVGGAQAAADEWRAGQEEAQQQQQGTMLAALKELRSSLADDTAAGVGSQLAVLEQAIVQRERPDARVLDALRVVRDQVLTSTGQGIQENRAMFEALSMYLTQSFDQTTANQRTLAQGIGRTIQQNDALGEGVYALVQQAQAQANLNAEQFMSMRTSLNQVAAAGNTLADMVQGLPQATFAHFYNQLVPRADHRQPNQHLPGTIPNPPPAPHHGALEAAYGGAALVRAQPPPAPSAQDLVPAPPPFPGQIVPADNGLGAVYGAMVPVDGGPGDGGGALVPAAPRTLTRLRLPGEADDDDMSL